MPKIPIQFPLTGEPQEALVQPWQTPSSFPVRPELVEGRGKRA